MFDPASLFAKVSVATPPDKRADRIPAGQHRLALANYYQKTTEKIGLIVVAEFVVMESSTVAVGTIVTHAWRMQLPVKWQQDNELGEMRAFVESLGGTKDQAQIAASGTALLAQNAGRGMLINAVGSPNATATWVDVTWSHYENQTPETIAQVRGFIDPLIPEKPPVAAPPVAQAPPPTQQFAPTASPAPLPAPSIAQAPSPMLPQGAAPTALLPQAPAPVAAPAGVALPFKLP